MILRHEHLIILQQRNHCRVFDPVTMRVFGRFCSHAAAQRFIDGKDKPRLSR